jgi:peptidoglycan/xylan/chitin deacetylase (PgdA/CDA1 family)
MKTLRGNASIPEKSVLLTFDDGYEDNYSIAWPIISSNDFRATFFIVSNLVGRDMMNWEQLRELAACGNSIGSHTVHHPDLTSINEIKQSAELSASKRELENHLDISVCALCFPSGKYGKATLKLMPELG